MFRSSFAIWTSAPHSIETFSGSLKSRTGHLDTKGIAYGDWPGTQGKVHVRPDGVLGVYLEDPDGHWIEINDHH